MNQNSPDKIENTDVEETDIIRKIANKEWESHRLDKEYSRLYSNIRKINRKFPVPENKLLKELLVRLDDLRKQRRKVLSDIKIERLNEYRRKVNFRRQVPEIVKAREELKLVLEKRNNAFKELNEMGEKYGSKLYNAGWDLFKLERDNPKEVKELKSQIIGK